MNTRDIVLIALFAALTAVLGTFPPIMVPAIAVPITAQSLAPMLTGGILGARRGGLALLLFVALVAVGMPFLSGGRGGLATLAGPWSGFIYGWALAAFVTGWLVERFWRRLNVVSAFAIAVLGGIGCVYAVGVPWFAAMSGVPVGAAFLASAASFVPGDLVKAAVAALAIVAVKRSYPIIGRDAARA